MEELALHSLFGNNLFPRISNVLDAHRDQTRADEASSANAPAGAKVGSLF